MAGLDERYNRNVRQARIVLADDHPFMLNGIRSLLESHYQIVGEAADGRALVDLTAQLNPDVVVTDISMPLLSGVDAARKIRTANPVTKIVFLTMHNNPLYLRQALKAGADGYVLKSGATEELRVAIDTALAGRVYVTPQFGHRVLSTLRGRDGAVTAGERLTERQREILQLIAEGRSNKEVAGILDVSVKTIEFHRARLMARMGVHNVAELTKRALEHGLIHL